MDEKLKKTLIKGGVVLGVGLILFFVTKKIVKKVQVKKQIKRDVLYEEELQGGMSTTQIDLEAQALAKYNPSNDVAYIKNVVYGLSWNKPRVAMNNKIMAKSNAQLKKLAQAYKKSTGNSLYEDLDDELDTCGDGGIFASFQNCFTDSMNRLSRMGLT